jgi:hypothetical protein
MLGANWGNLHALESIDRYDAFFIVHRELTKDLLTGVTASAFLSDALAFPSVGK